VARDPVRDTGVTPVNHDIQEKLEEFAGLYREPGRDELALLEAALFLEESFHILLTDAEISPETLGTLPLMRQLVAAKLSGA
jgi:hypothetical protein